MARKVRRSSDTRGDLVSIFTAAVEAVDPARLVHGYLKRRRAGGVVHTPDGELARWDGPLLVVGAGKAAAAMALGCERALGANAVRGLVVVPDRCEQPLSSIEVSPAGHPVPDLRGARATEKVCALVARAQRGPILFLISGGASSVFVRPRNPVTLNDKIVTNRLLLASGVDIGGVNTVRKHLSDVKGGGVLRIAKARPIVTLILSDVVGDDPSLVGSGPTTPDSGTYADAEAVLKSGGIFGEVPASVRTLLARGVRGQVPETVKPRDPESAGSVNVVVGSNRTALAAAAREAKRLGYTAVVADSRLTGDTVRCARAWVQTVEIEMARRPSERCCLIAGGETTVEVKGGGKGGRNQEFALAIAEELEGRPISVLSAGTDGIDGPTDAAGAFVAGDTLDRARQHGLDPAASLRNNDSYTFFSTMGDLFVCGATGTNVMDVKIALCPTSSPHTPVVQV